MSTLVIACPICLQKIRAPGNVLGRQIKCPQCKNGFTAVDPQAIALMPAAAQPPREADRPVDSEPAADPLGLENDVYKAAPVAIGTGSSVVDYLMFRRMVTPFIVTGLFYFGVAVILLVGLVFAAMTFVSFSGTKASILVGLTVLLDFVITVSALVMWRVLCEVILVLFRILDQLRER